MRNPESMLTSSFRRRLTLLSAVLIMAAGTSLTIGHLLIVKLTVEQQLTWTPPPLPPLPDGRVTTHGGGAAASTWILGVSEAVLRKTFARDLALLALFAAAAGATSWWMTGKVLSRVTEITATAREISQHDLTRRLELPGPRDEIKELADTLDDMLSRLHEAFSAQERFVANASHELRGPLTATRTALEAPLSQGRFPDGVRPSVLRALEANERSERLITALLNLARSHKQPDLPWVTCDLTQISRDMIEALSDDLARRHITLQTHLGTHVHVTGDHTLLTQAVFNLLDNAVTHNTDSGLVTVSTAATAAEASVTVENTGAEYSDVEAHRLKEPFYRGAATRLVTTNTRNQGTGLGLALIESIARRHQGHLHVASRREGGLVVTITIPRPLQANHTNRGTRTTRPDQDRTGTSGGSTESNPHREPCR
jgi:signal transduction histidine kinase